MGQERRALALAFVRRITEPVPVEEGALLAGALLVKSISDVTPSYRSYFPIDLSACLAASTVAAISVSVCASETNAASNWDGGQ